MYRRTPASTTVERPARPVTGLLGEQDQPRRGRERGEPLLRRLRRAGSSPTCDGSVTTPSSIGDSVPRSETTPVATLDWTTKPRIARRCVPSSTRSPDGKRRKAISPRRPAGRSQRPARSRRRRSPPSLRTGRRPRPRPAAGPSTTRGARRGRRSARGGSARAPDTPSGLCRKGSAAAIRNGTSRPV